jgi:hypothetical protein
VAFDGVASVGLGGGCEVGCEVGCDVAFVAGRVAADVGRDVGCEAGRVAAGRVGTRRVAGMDVGEIGRDVGPAGEPETGAATLARGPASRSASRQQAATLL